jgi:hypothetical protein
MACIPMTNDGKKISGWLCLSDRYKFKHKGKWFRFVAHHQLYSGYDVENSKGEYLKRIPKSMNKRIEKFISMILDECDYWKPISINLSISKTVF